MYDIKVKLSNKQFHTVKRKIIGTLKNFINFFKFVFKQNIQIIKQNLISFGRTLLDPYEMNRNIPKSNYHQTLHFTSFEKWFNCFN